METEQITSSANPQIKNLALLQKKSRARAQQDVFVAEGLHLYREAPAQRILKTYAAQSFYEKYRDSGIWKGEAPVVVADRVFSAVCDTDTPQGILCLVRRYHYRAKDVTKGETPLLLVVENLQDPGNLGTLLRTGEGAGVTGVILSGGTVDPYNPKAVRATMGSVYRVPFCYVEDPEDALRLLRARGITTYASRLAGALPYDGQDYRPGTAFLIGNEARGLSKKAGDAADVCVRIPMCGSVESLNAAVAAAVLLYEAHRQRSRS